MIDWCQKPTKPKLPNQLPDPRETIKVCSYNNNEQLFSPRTTHKANTLAEGRSLGVPPSGNQRTKQAHVPSKARVMGEGQHVHHSGWEPLLSGLQVWGVDNPQRPWEKGHLWIEFADGAIERMTFGIWKGIFLGKRAVWFNCYTGSGGTSQTKKTLVVIKMETGQTTVKIRGKERLTPLKMYKMVAIPSMIEQKLQESNISPESEA